MLRKIKSQLNNLYDAKYFINGNPSIFIEWDFHYNGQAPSKEELTQFLILKLGEISDYFDYDIYIIDDNSLRFRSDYIYNELRLTKYFFENKKNMKIIKNDQSFQKIRFPSKLMLKDYKDKKVLFSLKYKWLIPCCVSIIQILIFPFILIFLLLYYLKLYFLIRSD